MDDLEFEARLVRLFAEPPAFSDNQSFALAVETRLSRGWAWRRTLIVAAGAGGGLIAVGQMMGSGLIGRLSGAARVVEIARAGASRLPIAPQLSQLADMPYGGEAAWLALGLAALIAALLAGRSLRDL